MENTREWSTFGRYVLLDKVGSGGMAEIYRAKTFGAAGFEKEYAVKLILPSLVDDDEFVDMFINEAKIAVSLYHANIVQVFDLGQIEDNYFIAMEFVHGKDLLDVLARCAEREMKIPLGLVLHISMEMLKGLDFAHRAKDPFGEDLNIIHRDVSPSNILISYAGDVKVGDFGVAKAAIQRTLTETGTLKGKVGYMSPEQVIGEQIDWRSDIFAAGIVFFEALSMTRLFAGGSDLDVMLRVRDANIEDAIDKAGPWPSELRQIVCKALSRHREERFQTAGEFYKALVDFCFRRDLKITQGDVSNFMRRLFAEEIEIEKNRRRADPVADRLNLPETLFHESNTPSSQGLFYEPSSIGAVDPPPDRRSEPDSLEIPVMSSDGDGADDGGVRYRYRDGVGLIYGPMSARTLQGLVKNRPPQPPDQISVDGGPWLPATRLDLVRQALGLEPAPSSSDTAAAHHEIASPRPHASDLGTASTFTEVEVEDTLAVDSEVPANSEAAVSADFSDEIVLPRELEVDLQLPAFSRPDDERVGRDEAATAAQRAEAASSRVTLAELRDQYASYEGRLATTSFARILARLHRINATGRLYVEHEGTEKSIYFASGEPILVNSNREEELLGAFLIARDIIDQSQLAEALARLSEWGGRLGDALVAIGAIRAHDTYRLLSEQMQEKLLDVFRWPDGYYGYYENQEPETHGYPLGIDAYETIVEGCRRYIPLSQIVRSYEDRKRRPYIFREREHISSDRLRLSGKEIRIVYRARELSTLAQLLGKSELEEQDLVYRLFYLLHQVELVKFEATDPNQLPPSLSSAAEDEDDEEGAADEEHGA